MENLVGRLRNERLVGQCLVLSLLYVRLLVGDLRNVYRRSGRRLSSVRQWVGDSGDQDDSLRVYYVRVFG